MDIYNQTKNGNISIEKIQEDQEQFNSKLNEITTGNSKRKLKDQLDTIKKTKLSTCIMIMLKLYLKQGTKTKQGRGLKILTPK